MTVVSNIPQYYSYRSIYSEFLYGRQVHECLTHRFSNDTMFVGNNKRLEGLYSEMTKLWVILETLSELFNDNPIFSCDTLITDEVYLPRVVDTDVERKYIGYFNKLYSCLKTTIDNIKTCKKGLSAQYMIERCESEYNSGGSNGDSGCIIGDYNNDYNDDYFVEICNGNEVSSKLIICNTIYEIDSISISDNKITLSSVTGLTVGMNVEMGKDASGNPESVVMKITDITGNVLTVDTNISFEDYNQLMIVSEITYSVTQTLTVISTDISNSYYTMSAVVTVPQWSSVVITDINGIKYYDIIRDAKGEVLYTVLAGLIPSNIASFEVTDHIVNESYCE